MSVKFRESQNSIQRNESDAPVKLHQRMDSPATSPSLDDEVTYYTGIDATGHVAATSFWSWAGNDPATYGSPNNSGGKWGSATAGNTGGTVKIYFDPTSNYSAADQSSVMACFDLWSAVADISFTVTTDASQAQISIGKAGHSGGSFVSYGGSYAETAGVVGSATIPTYVAGSVTLDSGLSFSTPGSWGTILHEIGHTVGLGHTGPYNGSCDALTQQYSAYDNDAWSIMSYIGGSGPSKYSSEYTATGSTDNTWAKADIIAIQRIYGAATNTPLSGGQVFGFHCNITGSIRQFFDFSTNPYPFVTLWDAGTGNTLDLSGFSTNQTVNLNPGTFSSIAGQSNNLSIAFGTAIDTCIGSSGHDSITANNNGDVLQGGIGNDTLIGGTGADTASYQDATGGVTVDLGLTTSQDVGGGLGSDTLSSIENLLGSSFDDTLIGNAGNNVLNGAAGSDTVSYQNATSGVTVSLAASGAQTVGGGQGADTLVAIENLIGSSFDDTLTGDSGSNVLEGSAGDDTLNGGAGSDYASYAHATSAVTVNLAIGSAQAVGGGQGSDTLINIENLAGSFFDDALTGNAADNILEGSGGDDRLDGGAGSDTASYAHADVGVTVDLAITGRQNVGGAMGYDTLTNIENVLGSAHDDVLSGNAGNNKLDGGAGSDTVTYASATSGVTVDLSNISAQAVGGGQGNDTLANIENLVGSDYGDTLTGNSGDNILDGGAGNDAIDGGAGSDTASYAHATSGVTVSLAASSAQAVGGGMGSDTLSNIENLAGSAYDDTLTGNGGDNILDGGAGNDALDGGAGSDTVTYAKATGGVTVDLSSAAAQSIGGGMGVDTFANVENVIGSDFADILTGTSSTLRMSGGDGYDTLTINGVLNGSAHIDGGSGLDTLRLNGDYSAGLTLASGTVQNFETISFAAGHDYNITTDDSMVAAGQRTGIDASALGASDAITFDGSDETDGSFEFTAGAGRTVFTGGTGMDVVRMGSNLKATDVLVGGTGSNAFQEDDCLFLDGDYSAGLTLSATTFTGFESVTLSEGHDYRITTNDANFIRYPGVSGAWCSASIILSAGNDHSVYFDMSHETDTGVEFIISSGNNTIIDGSNSTSFLVYGGINKIVGGSEGELFMFGNGFAHGTYFNAENQIDGGAGSDMLYLSGDYATVPLVLGPTTIVNVERIMLYDGYDYDITANDATVAAGETVLIDASGLMESNFVHFNGAAETNGSYTIMGGHGDDVFAGGAGNDALVGGLGRDTVSYAQATSGVTVSLAISDAQAVGGGEGTDLLVGIENLIGSAYGDSLTGDGGDNVLIGGGGNDVLRGGAGSDTVDYSGATGSVTVNLATTTAQAVGGGQGSDTLSSIENLTGSAYADTLIGDGNNNILVGGGGADSLRPGMGSDTVSGGNGDDTISFTGGRFDASDVIDGGAGTDLLWLSGDYSGGNAVVMNATTLTNVENIAVAAGFNYSLTTADTTVGAGKALSIDTTSLGASNTLYFDGSAETDGSFTLLTGAGADTLIGGGGGDTFRAGGGYDHVSGNGGNDTISFSLGHLDAADVIDGGSGTDMVWLNSDYSGANAVTFNATTLTNVETIALSSAYSFNLTTADATVGAGKTLTIDGSSLGASKTLTFNGAAETDGGFVVIGGAGGDTLTGGAGNDTLSGRAGNDTLNAGFGNDVVSGGDGDDAISFTGGRLNAADMVDGGTGTDSVWLNGDYTGANAVIFNSTTVTNVESIGFAAGFSYSLKSSDGTVAAGKTLTVDASTLGVSNALTFDGSAETNGSVTFVSGSGADNLKGGSGADTFKYDAASRSSGLNYDTINALNFANDTFDIPGGVGNVTVIDAAKTSGSLSTASFDSDMAARMFYLGAHHAILFTPNAGTLAGQTFMVIDCNGTAGYQSGQDMVIRLNGYSGTLTAGAFH